MDPTEQQSLGSNRPAIHFGGIPSWGTFLNYAFFPITTESRDVEKGNPKTQWFKNWKNKNYFPRQKSPVDDTLWINLPFPGPGRGSSPWRKPWSSVPCLKQAVKRSGDKQRFEWRQHSQNQPKFSLERGRIHLDLTPSIRILHQFG